MFLFFGLLSTIMVQQIKFYPHMVNIKFVTRYLSCTCVIFYSYLPIVEHKFQLSSHCMNFTSSSFAELEFRISDHLTFFLIIKFVKCEDPLWCSCAINIISNWVLHHLLAASSPDFYLVYSIKAKQKPISRLVCIHRNTKAKIDLGTYVCAVSRSLNIPPYSFCDFLKLISFDVNSCFVLSLHVMKRVEKFQKPTFWVKIYVKLHCFQFEMDTVFGASKSSVIWGSGVSSMIYSHDYW